MSDSSKKRHIFLAMPGYGDLTAGAALGFFEQPVRDRSQIAYKQYRCGSLLAANFNGLWVTALNYQQHGGKEITHFAMQHSDIEPEEYWLDKLIDELDSHDLDVLGVVAPIKDSQGMTSIALHDPDGDNWQPKCRLSMAEIHRLPATFMSDDVGYPVLINTGLWVCRFDPAWNTKVRFTINDELVRYEDGRFGYHVESEDWYISRLFHELGLRIGVTRKIRLAHMGKQRYVNHAPWGNQTFDRGRLTESVIPDAAYEFPHDVKGWLSTEEGEKLRELAKGKRVLEIGSYCGRSTICLAQSAEHVTSCDPFDGSATPDPQGTFGEFVSNVKRYGVHDKIKCVHPDDPLPLDEYDLVFIDGDHSYEAVQHDIERALSVLVPGGLIAFHDYRKYEGQHDGRWDPDVSRSVDEFVSSGATLISTHDSLAVVRPPAEIPLEV